jgi:predicted ATP-grasp superfamily ATP-dependent carboligase
VARTLAPMRALIVEPGYTRGALAASRALSHAGWTVGIASPQRGGLASSSRWTHHWHRVPIPRRGSGSEAFLRATRAAIEEGEYAVVFGGGDAEALAISAGRRSLPAPVPYAPHESVVRAFDKLELGRAAQRAGIRTPATVDASALALAAAPDRPMWVKARLQAVPGTLSGTTLLNTTLCRDRTETIQRAAEIRRAGGQPVFQEFIPGTLMAFSVVADEEGRVVAGVQQLAERTWRPEGGVSTRAVTVPVDEELAERVAHLVRELAWFGLAELQFVLPADGEPRLIDFNGRFYGSLSLAVAAGVNLPAIWASLAAGRPVPEPREATVGVRYHWLEGDLRRARVERRGGLIRDVVECLRYARGAEHSIWDREDPLPAIRYPRYLIGRDGRKLARRAIARLR